MSVVSAEVATKGEAIVERKGVERARRGEWLVWSTSDVGYAVRKRFGSLQCGCPWSVFGRKTGRVCSHVYAVLLHERLR